MLYRLSNLLVGVPIACFEAILLEKLYQDTRKKCLVILCMIFMAVYCVTNLIGQEKFYLCPILEAGAIVVSSLLLFHSDKKKKWSIAIKV